MTPLDRLLQRWRIATARPYIPPGSRLLDVGCADGALFKQLAGRIRQGVGIDAGLRRASRKHNIRFLPGKFPDGLPHLGTFDVITLLALLEHIPQKGLKRVAQRCADLLKPGGWLVITVPSPHADWVLDCLKQFRLIHGMSLKEHHRFEVRRTPALFARVGLEMVTFKQFQLGFNNLFVFRKPERARGRVRVKVYILPPVRRRSGHGRAARGVLRADRVH